jgi:hypothetical protein
MNRKLKSTLGLVGLLIIILLAGGIYIFVFQSEEIKDKQQRLKELKANDYNTEQLNIQLLETQNRASVLDSVLAARRFNIPPNLSSIKFFNFINEITTGFSSKTKIDVEFVAQKQDREFFVYQYKIAGAGEFMDVFRLIYAVEQSKELKKVTTVTLTNSIISDKEGLPNFMVNFDMNVDVYYATNNRFATADFVEHDLAARPLYDAFYPLIRNEIPPNIEGLLDIQGAKLLAIIPEGAFLADTRGQTFLLWEGEQVYLGYLTKIDYDNNRVSFILNKGGIIEKIDLFLEKEVTKKN